MSKDNVSYRDLYKVIDEFRKENNQRFDKLENMFLSFYKSDYEPLKDRFNSFAAKVTVIGTALLLGINIGWDFIKERLFGGK